MLYRTDRMPTMHIQVAWPRETFHADITLHGIRVGGWRANEFWTSKATRSLDGGGNTKDLGEVDKNYCALVSTEMNRG